MTAGAQQLPLGRARAEAAAGKFARAEEDYRAVLQGDPGNSEALGGMDEALEAAGHWRDAMPFLYHLIEMQPNNSSRILQLTRLKSWQADTRSDAMSLLRLSFRADH